MKPSLHGRDHRPARGDPIPGVIVFEYPNEGEWLDITANGPAPGGGRAIHIEATGTGLDGTILIQNGLTLINLLQAILLQGSAVVVKLTGDDPTVGFFDEFVISGHTADLNLLRIHNDGLFTFRFRDASSQLEVLDSAGDPIMRLDDDGTLHLKTGATVVSDL